MLSNDPNPFAILTPGHFVIGWSLCSIPEPYVLNLPANRLNRWQYMQQLLQSFGRRWSTENLHHLQQSSKWHSDRSWERTVGDLVLLKEDNIPPLVWKTRTIEEVFPGQDGHVRVALVRTSRGHSRDP
jgi:hypothetical protein